MVKRFKRFALEVMDVENVGSDLEIAYNGIIALENFYKEIGMPTRLKELEIYEDSFKALAYNYTFKGTRIIPDRIKIGYEDALAILELAK